MGAGDSRTGAGGDAMRRVLAFAIDFTLMLFLLNNYEIISKAWSQSIMTIPSCLSKDRSTVWSSTRENCEAAGGYFSEGSSNISQGTVAVTTIDQSYYTYEPKDDITAPEVAQILKA